VENKKMMLKEKLDDIAYKFRYPKRKVSIDLNDFLIYSMNPFKLNFRKEMLLQAMLRNIKPNDVIYDVGANIGLYSMAIAKAVDTRLFAFEPNPETFTKLNKNISLNKFCSIKAFNFALGNKDSITDFLMSNQPERSSFYKYNAAWNTKIKKTIQVEVKQIDSLCLPLPQHIKIDTEGAEPLVLQGATQTILKSKPILYIESHGIKDNCGGNESIIANILKELGYKNTSTGVYQSDN
jgi:FkbM family methyltransferase